MSEQKALITGLDGTEISFWEKEVVPPIGSPFPTTRTQIPKVLEGTFEATWDTFNPKALEKAFRDSLNDATGKVHIDYWIPYYLFPKRKQAHIKYASVDHPLENLIISFEEPIEESTDEM